MAEKRPRTTPLSKRDPAYWAERLFHNAYSYQGKRTEVASWSVKIQVFGKRKSFTLTAADRSRAAAEACQTYRTIIDNGWEAAIDNRGVAKLWSRGPARQRVMSATLSQDLEHWRQRLIHRRYPEPAQPSRDGELSVWIEHARSSQCFPLGTSNANEAATLAMRIHRTVVTEGWTIARARFPRELSVALRWQDNPLAWTYTTIHTLPSGPTQKPLTDPTDHASRYSVALIEPDVAIRSALVICVNSQEGFQCSGAFGDTAEALRQLTSRRVDLVLVNHDLPDEPSTTYAEQLQRLRPELTVLSYSVFSDADELFKSTPGGAVVYMLKRTGRNRLLEPIAGMAGTATREQIASHVRDYFQHLSALLPSGSPLWKFAKLTPREHEILAFLSRGALVKEIADSLGISNWTVHGHMKSIFEKLKVHTRTEAVIKYLQK